jgi:hypothetical protein
LMSVGCAVATLTRARAQRHRQTHWLAMAVIKRRSDTLALMGKMLMRSDGRIFFNNFTATPSGTTHQRKRALTLARASPMN